LFCTVVYIVSCAAYPWCSSRLSYTSAVQSSSGWGVPLVHTAGPLVKGMGWGSFLALNIAINGLLFAWCLAYHLLCMRRWKQAAAVKG
jgi:hypothetical protein